MAELETNNHFVKLQQLHLIKKKIEILLMMNPKLSREAITDNIIELNRSGCAIVEELDDKITKYK